MKKNKSCILLLLILLCACTKQYPIKLTNDQQTKYVLNGFVVADNGVRIQLSRADRGNSSADNSILTATVKLYEGEQFIEQLFYQTPNTPTKGSYVSSGFKAQAGKKYTIRATIPSYEKELSATDIVPKSSCKIIRFTVDTVTGGMGIYKGEIVMEDLDASENYYNLSVQSRIVSWFVNGTDTTYEFQEWQEAEISSSSASLSDIIPDEPFIAFGSEFPGILTKDIHFNQAKKTFDFSTISGFSANNTYIETRAVVRTVSANYFHYFLSTAKHLRTQDNPQRESVSIHNNVVNGLGNFSAYNMIYSDVARINL